MFVSVYSRTDQTPTSTVYQVRVGPEGEISTNILATLMPSVGKSI